MATKEQYFEAIEHALSLPCPDDMAIYLSKIFLAEEYDEAEATKLHGRYLYSKKWHGRPEFRFSHPAYYLTGGRYSPAKDYYPTPTLRQYWEVSENFDYANNKPKADT